MVKDHKFIDEGASESETPVFLIEGVEYIVRVDNNAKVRCPFCSKVISHIRCHIEKCSKEKLQEENQSILAQLIIHIETMRKSMNRIKHTERMKNKQKERN